MTDRKLRVFLCHASQDKPITRELYRRLLAEGWIDPWLDEEKLLPGQDWDMEIEKAVENAHAVIVCLSRNSITKEGYVQRELKYVLDVALEKSEGAIFVIPLRLDKGPIPRRLKNWQGIDYFPVKKRDAVFNKLLRSLETRHSASQDSKSVSKGGNKKSQYPRNNNTEGEKTFMELKVFLSSTYLDLKNYREVVANALRKQGYRVKGVEADATRDEELTEAALSELGKCDIVVGIYAHRYGHIPGKNEFSLTEQEYWHAKSKEKPLFCFVVDEDYPWPPKMIEQDSIKASQLKKFIANIKKEKFVDFFTTPENLASQVVAAIGRYVGEKVSDKAAALALSHPRSSLPYLPYFFGREKELKNIAESISPDVRTWGVLIDGPGGIGKTALAIKAAQDAPDNIFDRKIFITAKTHELTPAGTKELGEYARINYLALLRELALELGEDSIPKLIEEEQANALRRALTKQRALIIFDNLETLDDSDASHLYQFLSLLPQGNKAIVTSRRRSDVDVRIIRLNRLNPGEVKELIAELAKTNPLLQAATIDEIYLLNIHTRGNPLLIKWVIGQLGRKGSNLRTIAEAIEFMKQASRNNDPLGFIFGDLIRTLSGPERIVLASLTHLGSATLDRIPWISQMSDELPQSTIEYICDELSDRSILISDNKSTEYYLPTVTSGFIRSRLSDEVDLAGYRLAKYVIRLAVEFGERKNYSGIKRLEREWPAILAALPYFFKGRNDDFQILCELLEPFMKSSGRWDEMLWIYQNAELKAVSSGDYYSASLRAYNVALIHSYRGQSNDVFRYAALTAEYAKKADLISSAKRNPFVSYIYGVGYKLENNYEIAIKFFKEALSILEGAKDEKSLNARVLNSLAEAELEYGNITDAEEYLIKALHLADDKKDQEGILIYKGNLAELALAQRNWAKAEELGRDALNLAEQLGEQEEIARDNYRTALALMKQGFLSQAYSYAKASVTIYGQLRHKDLSDAQEIYLRCKEEIQKGNKRS